MENISVSLESLAADFVSYKQALGYKYERAAWWMQKFIQFAEAFPETTIPGKEICQAWLKPHNGEQPVSINPRISYLREFSRYLNSVGYDNAYVIPKKIGAQRTRHVPYFFTDHELSVFFQECNNLKHNPSRPGREWVIPAIFQLLYCCGLRPLEAVTLCRDCVNLDVGYADILQSKGPKSRRIFFGTELNNVMFEYDRAIGGIYPNRKFFFPHGLDGHYKERFVSSNFNRLWGQAFPDFQSEVKPRAYDFRHHFALKNINRWVQGGQDINVMLPYLMRYMGHASLKSTCYYIHFVPEFFSTFNDMTKVLSDILPEVDDEATI